MNKKQLLLDVMDSKSTPRIPFSFWYHFSGEASHGTACVDAHMAYYRKYDLDFIKIMSDGISYPLDIHIEKASDWYSLKPLSENHPFFTEALARCKEINRRLDGECCTFYNFFSAFNTLKERDVFSQQYQQGRSTDETLMQCIREDADAVRFALGVVGSDFRRLAELLLGEGGCTGIYQSVQGAERGRFSAEQYASIVAPSELMVLKRANELSRYNILHMCCWAGYANHLEYWRDYPALVKNWGVGLEELSLHDALSFFPGAVLLGGLDNRPGYTFVDGPEEALRAEIRECAKQMQGHPYIMGADCTLPAARMDLDRINIVKDELSRIAKG